MVRASLFAILLLLVSTVAFAGPEYPVGKPIYGPAPGDRWQPSVATDGDDYLVVWRDIRSTTERVIATRVSKYGAVRDPFGIVISEGPAVAPKAVWNGSTYLVVWGANGPTPRILAATVDRNGQVSGPRVLSENGFLSSLNHSASDGRGTLVVYMRGTQPEPHALLVDRDSRVLSDAQLAPAGTQRSDVTVATTGNGFLVAWSVYSQSAAEAEVIPVSAEGTPVGSPRNIGFGASPLLASDGSGYVLVARRHHSGEYTWSSRHISIDLSEVTPPLPLPEGSNLTQPSLLWNSSDSEYLFIAQQYPITTDTSYFLAATRIGTHGWPLESPRRVEQLQIGGGVEPG